MVVIIIIVAFKETTISASKNTPCVPDISSRIISISRFEGDATLVKSFKTFLVIPLLCKLVLYQEGFVFASVSQPPHVSVIHATYSVIKVSKPDNNPSGQTMTQNVMDSVCLFLLDNYILDTFILSNLSVINLTLQRLPIEVKIT